MSGVAVEGESRLTSQERRVVLGAAIALAGSVFCSSSYNFVIQPMVTSLHASESQSAMLRQLPGIGGLLAIFVAGVLVMKIGARKCLAWSGLLMIVGFLITCLAPNMAALTTGLLFAYVGKAAVIVIVVSLLGSSIRGKDARASAFATFAMVAPGVCVVIPILAAWVVDGFGWRWVAVIWLVGGMAVIAAALLLIPRSHEKASQSGELWTPILAGVVLVGLTQIVRLAATDGPLATSVLIFVAVTLAAAALLAVLTRRMSEPSLSFSVLRDGHLALLLVVVLLMSFSNMWFYGTIGAQSVYGLSALTVSLIFVPVQLAGVVGAKLSGRLVKARGITFAGTATLLATAVMSFLCVVQTTTVSILVPAVILMLYGAFANGTTGTVTNAVMSVAPKGQEGDTSAYRTAAGSLGSSVGAVVMSTIVFSTMALSISNQSTAAGVNPQEARQVANDLREGATSQDASSQYGVPVTTVDEVQSFHPQAAVVGFRAQGIAGGTILLAASGIFYVARRRRDLPTTSASV